MQLEHLPITPLKPLALLLTVCLFLTASGLDAADLKPLTFFIVSEEKIEKGRFMDTPGMPQLGYISQVPDLVVKGLKSVRADVSKSFDGSVDKDGKFKLGPMQESPAIVLEFRPEDAAKFTALTTRAIHKRLLLMLGDTPLMAPLVNETIPGSSVQVTIPPDVERKNIVLELEKLVP